jgi:hypothetical protein
MCEPTKTSEKHSVCSVTTEASGSDDGMRGRGRRERERDGSKNCALRNDNNKSGCKMAERKIPITSTNSSAASTTVDGRVCSHFASVYLARCAKDRRESEKKRGTTSER